MTTARARFVSAPRARVAVSVAVILVAVTTAIGTYHVSRRKELIRLGYEITEVRRELRGVREVNRKLRVESSVLTNPERIERLARALGMQRPEPSQLRVAPGDSDRAKGAQ